MLWTIEPCGSGVSTRHTRLLLDRGGELTVRGRWWDRLLPTQGQEVQDGWLHDKDALMAGGVITVALPA
jgi:hypothetical protein